MHLKKKKNKCEQLLRFSPHEKNYGILANQRSGFLTREGSCKDYYEVKSRFLFLLYLYSFIWNKLGCHFPCWDVFWHVIHVLAFALPKGLVLFWFETDVIAWFLFELGRFFSADKTLQFGIDNSFKSFFGFRIEGIGHLWILSLQQPFENLQRICIHAHVEIRMIYIGLQIVANTKFNINFGKLFNLELWTANFLCEKTYLLTATNINVSSTRVV